MGEILGENWRKIWQIFVVRIFSKPYRNEFIGLIIKLEFVYGLKYREKFCCVVFVYNRSFDEAVLSPGAVTNYIGFSNIEFMYPGVQSRISSENNGTENVSRY